MNKMKAFTILEALISLVITGIIIGLTYTIFISFGKQFINHNNGNSQMIDFQLFESTFKNDLYLSNQAYVENDKLYLENYDESFIEYKLNNNRLLRSKDEGANDFDLHFYNWQIEVDNRIESSEKVMKIELTLKVLNDTLVQSFYKYMDKSKFINEKFLNEN